MLDPVRFKSARLTSTGRRIGGPTQGEQHLGPQGVNVRGTRIVEASRQVRQTFESGFEVARRRQPLRLRQGRHRLRGGQALTFRRTFPVLLERPVAVERRLGGLPVSGGGKRPPEPVDHFGFLRRQFRGDAQVFERFRVARFGHEKVRRFQTHDDRVAHTNVESSLQVAQGLHAAARIARQRQTPGEVETGTRDVLGRGRRDGRQRLPRLPVRQPQEGQLLVDVGAAKPPCRTLLQQPDRFAGTVQVAKQQRRRQVGRRDVAGRFATGGCRTTRLELPRPGERRQCIVRAAKRQQGPSQRQGRPELRGRALDRRTGLRQGLDRIALCRFTLTGNGPSGCDRHGGANEKDRREAAAQDRRAAEAGHGACDGFGGWPGHGQSA